MGLTEEERETVISWADDDTKIFIYTTQRKIITKLNKNPLFELKRDIFSDGVLIGKEGYLPLGGITIRASKRKSHLSSLDKENIALRLKSGRDRKAKAKKDLENAKMSKVRTC